MPPPAQFFSRRGIATFGCAAAPLGPTLPAVDPAESPMRRSLPLAFAALFLAAVPASAHWPQWRGPRGDGSSDAKDVPVRWSATENVVWRTPLPGRSGATPALWGDKLFVSTPDGPDLFLYCVGTGGKVEWKRKVGTGNKNRGFNSKNNYATPSPMTDGKHVWILVGSGDLACFDFAGTV